MRRIQYRPKFNCIRRLYAHVEPNDRRLLNTGNFVLGEYVEGNSSVRTHDYTGFALS